jgi:phosphoglycerate dehydrogenase-like enzyme
MKFKKIVITGLNEPEIGKKFWDKLDKLTDKKIFINADDPALITELTDADCLFSKFNPVTKEMFDTAKNLKYIGVFGTGFGKIDKESAEKNKVTVCNIPGYSTESVAEFVFAVLLEKLRDLECAKKQTREGNYSESGFSAIEIKGKNFGIIGLGRIGSRVAEIAKGFSANVKYWSRSKKEVNNNFEYLELDDLLESCDIVSIHLAFNDETKGMLNQEKINKLKNGTILINTAPMELVDLEAIEKRLKKDEITFILDHSDEMDKDILKKLAEYKNCIIYPPIAYISNEASIAKQEIFVSNIENYLKGSPSNKVI